MTENASLPIVVVGGGISGLAAAHRLTELLPNQPLKLLEASSRLGGILETVRENGYLLETSADNFITRLPWAKSLCERVGLGDQLLPTEPSLRRALVVRNAQIMPVPEAFVLMSARRLGPVLGSPVLSWRGKLRLLAEPFVGRRQDTADESVANFARRRLGNEVFERLVQPLVAGIYTADPEKLSMRATMRQFVEREQQYGSLWRARKDQSEAADSGARYSNFVAPARGMSQLVDAVAARLPDGAIECNSPVGGVTRSPQEGTWLVHRPKGSALQAAAVVIATPAPQAAMLVEQVDAELSQLLGGIEMAGASIVALGVRRDQIRRPIEGFGFVVPQVEGRQIIAASFGSLKFPGRAPDGRLLIRVFVGGALQPELAALEEGELITLAHRELAELVGLEGEAELCRVIRWPASMPQYHVGHLDRVERIETLAACHAGLALAGNAYHGVGVPQCVRSGELAAERLAEYLRNK